MTSAEGLHSAFWRQRAAHARDGGLTLDERRAELKRLRALVKDNAEAIAIAISQDFGGRSRHETLVAEVGVILGAIDHALPRLARWSRPERVGVGWRYWPARGEVLKQPLGVVGVPALAHWLAIDGQWGWWALVAGTVAAMAALWQVRRIGREPLPRWLADPDAIAWGLAPFALLGMWGEGLLAATLYAAASAGYALYRLAPPRDGAV